MAIVLTSTCCMAQKKVVNSAKNKASNTEAPDFEGARADIKAALANDETKDQANTWYVAGLIGYKENEYAMVREQIYQQPKDKAKVGEAIVESYNYWLKADELAMIPTLDKKGREVVDTKTRKQIADKMFEYYNNKDLILYGVYLNDKNDQSRAYDVFMMHLAIPELAMMQTEKFQKEMPKDTTYMQYKYWAGLFAVQSERHEEAVKIFEEMKNGDYEAIDVNKFLYQEYVELKDTVAFIRVLQDAMVRFPNEPWFLQNLINHYIYTGQQRQAVDYLRQAIEREPGVVQYYTILGRLYNDNKAFDDAFATFNKARELDPNNAEAWAGVGYVYVDRANFIQDNIDVRASDKVYNAEMARAKENFHAAIEYFEKAHELDGKNRYYVLNLKQLYGRFRAEKGMQAKYDAMVKLLEEM